jgi:hypothetical protein
MFINHVMKAARGGVTDVHAGPFANGFETFEDLDLVGVIVADVGA